MPKATEKSRHAAHLGISARYLTALRAHLGQNGAAKRGPARRLGDAAVAGGLATLDLAIMHEQALMVLAPRFDFGKNARSRAIRQAGAFFTEALVPLEAVQRATRRDNELLLQRNLTLRAHARALAKGNRRLQLEVERREAGEIVIRRGKEQYRHLFLESQTMQKRLRQLTHQIISAQEDERKEISRELHDEVVQTLVGINVELAALGKGARSGLKALKQKISRTQRLVENSVNAVHRFARQLRPAVLDDLGLIPALHAYNKSLAARKKLKIKMTAFGGVEALGASKRTVLFRVAQEALTNVARHAHATQVRMSLNEMAGAIRMEISDNGRSFAVGKALSDPNPKRLGLIGMKERIEMVGGTLSIASEPGKGTTVCAIVPFRAETSSL
jgi:signal transduction histidine kinase